MKKQSSQPTARYQQGIAMPLVLFLLTGLVVFVVFLMYFANIKTNGVKNQEMTMQESESLDENMNFADSMDSNNDMHDDTEGISVEEIEQMSYQYYGQLEDVSGGSSSGIVRATFEDTYKMVATFENLPLPDEGYFYEGWIVSPKDVLSTGKAEKIGDEYVNEFISTEDLTEYNYYVLTLEPDDGDPAPAEHVLEGAMSML